MQDVDDPIGAAEAARIMQVNRNHVTYLARTGALPIRGRRGNGLRAPLIFERADVLGLAQQRRRQLSAKAATIARELGKAS